MQYVMLVRIDPDVPVPEDTDPSEWVAEGERAGMRLSGGPVEEPETATTVRVRDGRTLVTDGPFPETKEWIAGYDLLQADSLDQAVDYATRHPVARFGALELREVWGDFVPERDGEPLAPREEGNDYLFLHVPEAELVQGLGPEGKDPTPWVREVEDRRVTLGGSRLRIADEGTAATVRIRNGETLVTRGPFAETIEEIAGIDLVRVDDLDEAIELAAKHPTTTIGAIEIRPFPSDV
jgi:hypothetical protein